MPTDTANSTSQIFKDCGIRDVAKLTHHRSAALQLGGFKGLSESENNALTDHKLDKHHSAYGPVCVAKTCKVMAGFDIDDAYFVPRSMIELPNSVLWYVRKLLPNYDKWKTETTSANGDKSTFCAMFLNDLLPWLVEVIVQDGCYFVQDFPDHVISKLLRMKIPAYDRFALQSRRWVREKQNSRQLDKITALNGASRASYEALQRQVDKLQSDNNDLKESVQRLENKIDALISELVTQRASRHEQQKVHQPQLHEQQEQDEQDSIEAQKNTEPKNTEPLLTDQPRPTLNEALAYPPRMAPFESKLPKSLALLWREWDFKSLEQYRRLDKGRLGWPRHIRIGYERRMYLVDKIMERAEACSITIPEAARRMDGPSQAGTRQGNEENRDSRTVYQFWQYLHDNDVSIQRRATRKPTTEQTGRERKRPRTQGVINQG
jgi:hypothetical protein